MIGSGAHARELMTLPPRCEQYDDLPPLVLDGVTLDWRSTCLMGVVNVTPDSFSDGGRFGDVRQAARWGVCLARDGADILDVGGESTRPGARPVSATEEMDRVLPVIRELREAVDRPLSIDTYKAEVARRACEEGACLVNDVSGATMDPEILHAAAEAGAAVILGHIRGTPATMQADVAYADLLGEVSEFLQDAVERAVAAGVTRERILVDPGIGFGKSPKGNLALIKSGGRLRAILRRPVMIGASRKAFIGKLTGAELGDRLPGTLAAHALARVFGADVIRVHDVREARQAASLVDALLETRTE